MSYFVRKIAPSKWENNNAISDVRNYNADCFSDINTTKNQLSVWKVSEISDSSILEVASVLASEFKTKVGFISLVCFEENKAIDTFVSIVKDDKTKCALIDKKTEHYEIDKMNYNKLGLFAKCVYEEKIQKRVFKVIWDDIVQNIKTLIAENKIDITKLGEALKKSL